MNTQTDLIYHLTTPDSWQEAQQEGQLSHPSLEQDGFLHASTKEQLCATANRYFAAEKHLLVLVIEIDKLTHPLKFEPPHPPSPTTKGQLFPHIYGPVPLDAIISAHTMHTEHKGSYTIPDDLP